MVTEMIEFDIERGSLLQTGMGISPTHKITLKQGSETSVIWYLQEPSACVPAEPHFDQGALARLFVQAQALHIGDFLYFSMGDGRDYHLQRVANRRFTLKSLT